MPHPRMYALSGWLTVCLLFGGCLVALAQERELSEEDRAAIAEVRSRLEKSLTVDMPEVLPAKAFEVLARRAKVEIHLCGVAAQAPPQRKVSVAVEEARALDVLDVLCALTNLSYELVPRGVEVFTRGDLASRRLTLRAYAVDDLVTQHTDFPDTLAGSDWAEVRAAAPGIMNPYVAQQSQPMMTAASIKDMIRLHVRPESWDPAQGTSIEQRGALLVVMTTEEIHELIGRMLAGLRARLTRQVAIEARVVSAASRDVDRIRGAADARGVSPPLWDAQALEALDQLLKAGAAAQLFAGATTVFNTQLGRLQSLTSRPVLADVEMSGETWDPVVADLVHGLVLTACPLLSDDATQVTLSVSLRRTEPLGPPEAFQVLHGGVSAVPTDLRGRQTINVTRRAPEPPPAEAKAEKEERYEITVDGPPALAPQVAPFQLQLPTTTVQEARQDLSIEAGKTAGFSAPFSTKEGLVQGRELLVLLRCQPQVLPPPPLEPEKVVRDEIPAELKQRLEKMVTWEFIDTPFRRAVDHVANVTKVPLVLDATALEETGLTRPISLRVKDMKASEALPVLLRMGDSDIIPYPSLLLVSSRHKVSARRMALRVFDVRDMTKSRADYPGRTMLPARASGGVQAMGVAFAQQADWTVGLSAPDIAALVKDSLFPADFANPATSVEEQAGQLVIVNSPEVLAKIESTLKEFRKTARRPVCVTMRWAVVNGADLRAALGPDATTTLSPAEAGKVMDLILAPAARDLSAVRLIAFNGQRVSAFGGLARSVVWDYDASGEIYDPIIGVLRGGVQLDVRPLTMEATGGPGTPTCFMLETRIAFTRLEASPPTFDFAAPAAAQEKPAAGGLPAPPRPGRIHTPATDLQEIACTVRVPDGGAALFRLPVPPWLEGEDQEAVKKGERIGIVLLQAQQQK